jgi:hypothetical protein
VTGQWGPHASVTARAAGRGGLGPRGWRRQARELGRAEGHWAQAHSLLCSFFFFSILHSLFPNSILNSDLNSNHVANYPQLVL